MFDIYSSNKTNIMKSSTKNSNSSQRNLYLKIVFILILFFTCIGNCTSQEKINWISFEQLEDSLKVKPKKVKVESTKPAVKKAVKKED